MFTGIIEAVGKVVGVEPTGDLTRLAVEAAAICEGVAVGDSIAVNGVCLTVTLVTSERLSFDAVRETLECTALSRLTAGSRVNLERAVRAGGRLDGHIVQGHVDGTGRVRDLVREGEDVRLFVECSPDVADFLVEKGSVAIDGVSLTVVGAEEKGFAVALIPHTLANTTLGGLAPRDSVNLEADVLGKYVKRYLERVLPGRA